MIDRSIAMLVCLVATLVAAIAGQAPPSERAVAEQLARSGRTSEAVVLFERIVEQDPADIEARLWVARLKLRLGLTAEAEAGFRSVVAAQPNDVDARIGLASTLVRRGAPAEAIAVLTGIDAGENADFFSTLGRAYRRIGDDGRALEYFRRAKALSPADPEIAAGYESVAQVYGHWVGFDGFGEDAEGTATTSGRLVGSIRVAAPLHLLGSARVQQRDGATDTLAGGGVLWRMRPTVTVGARAVGGSGNTSLPSSDVSGELTGYAGVFEAGFNVRRLSFATADVLALSPVFAFDSGGRWRADTRYTYSRSTFPASGDTSGDHSIMLRESWRGSHRMSVMFTYAYGIESFEELTADRLGSLGSTTAAAGLKISLPSLSAVTTTWEHQWRSNNTKVDRLVVSLVQTFP